MSSPFSLVALRNAAAETIRRFPIEMLVAAIACGVGSILAHGTSLPETTQTTLSLILAVLPTVFALQLAISILREQRALPLLMHIAGRVIAAAIGVVLVLSIDLDSEAAPIQLASAFLAAHASVVLAVFHRGSAATWLFGKTLFLRMALALLFSSVLSSGLALAVVAVSVLFSIDLSESVYGDIYAFTYPLFNTFVLLAGVPRLVDERPDLDVPKALRWFVQFVLVPLVGVFLVILYAYGVRVMFFTDLQGAVSGFILPLGVFSILAWLLSWPLRYDTSHRLLMWYHQYLGIALVPVTAILVVATWVRIAEYGVTPERYALAILTTFMVSATILLLRGTKADVRLLPLLIVVLGTATAVGPLDSRQSTIRSQTRRLQQTLEQSNALTSAQRIDTLAFQRLDDSIRLEVLERVTAVSRVDTVSARGIMAKYGVQLDQDGSPSMVRFVGMGAPPQRRLSDEGTYLPFPKTTVDGVSIQDSTTLWTLSLTTRGSDTAVTESCGTFRVRLRPQSTMLQFLEGTTVVDSIRLSTVATRTSPGRSAQSVRDRLLRSASGRFSVAILGGEIATRYVSSLELLVLEHQRPSPVD